MIRAGVSKFKTGVGNFVSDDDEEGEVIIVRNDDVGVLDVRVLVVKVV